MEHRTQPVRASSWPSAFALNRCSYMLSRADSPSLLLWIAGRDQLCTYFNKPWLEFTGRTLEVGLTSMRERLKLVGGELFIESRSARGTSVLARAPIKPLQ